jgi:signal transduction histidine kinase
MQDLSEPFRLFVTIDAAASALTTPAFIHLVLAYPSGYLVSRSHLWLVRISYAIACLQGLVSALIHEHSLLLDHWFSSRPVFYQSTGRAEDALVVAGGLGLLLLLGSLRRAPTLAKPLRVPLYFVAAVSAVVDALIVLHVIGHHDSRDLWLYLALQALVPLALMFGLLAERRGRVVAADLLLDLDRSPVDRIEQILGNALKDPKVTVRFVLDDDTRVDVHGESVDLVVPDGRSVLTVRGADTVIAEIVHDSMLNEQRDLLRSVAVAARFALENARMQARLRSQVDELRVSRERIVEAAEAERRRIERNLHDGTQQRLVALGMQLDDMRRGLRATPNAESLALTGALDDAVGSLRITMTELRALARGVHPPILTVRGLGPAVRSLLDRLPVAVTLQADAADRFDPSIEAAAYYVVSESLTNALRHAQADRIDVAINRSEGSLVVAVTDDGIGE